MSDKARQILCVTLFVVVSALSNVLPLDTWLDSARSALAQAAESALPEAPPLRPPPASDPEARLDFTMGHINTQPIAELAATYAALEQQQETLPPRVANFKQMLGHILGHKRKMRDPLGTHPEEKLPSLDSPSTPPPPEPEVDAGGE